MQCQVLLASNFRLKWHVVRIKEGGVLPESGKFLDSQILFGSILLVTKVFNNDITEDPWYKHVKLFEVSNNMLCVTLQFQQLPKILNNFLTMSVSTLLTLLIKVDLVRILQFIKYLLLEPHWIRHDMLWKLARFVPWISYQSLNVH